MPRHDKEEGGCLGLRINYTFNNLPAGSRAIRHIGRRMSDRGVFVSVHIVLIVLELVRI